MNIKALNVFAFPNYIKKYLLIAYGFSFFMWIAAWLIAANNNVSFLVNHEILNWKTGSIVLLASFLSVLANYGPILGYFSVRKHLDNKAFSNKGLLQALGVFSVFALAAVVASLVLDKLAIKPAFLYLGLVVVYYMLTSAVEEFGWRGVLFPYIKEQTSGLWESSLVMAILWGLWHTPIVLYIFVQQGMGIAAIIPSFFGFLMSIALSSYSLGWLYLRNGNYWPSYLLHGLLNWWPVVLLKLFVGDMNWLVIIIGYIATLVFLEFRYSSKKYFKKSI